MITVQNIKDFPECIDFFNCKVKELEDSLTTFNNKVTPYLNKLKAQGKGELELKQFIRLAGVMYDIHNVKEDLKRYKSLQKLYKQVQRGDKLIDIDAAKEVSILAVLRHYGAEVKMNKTNCLIHTEKSASMQIYTKTNSFYCFGCGKGGDTIKLIQEVERINFKEAVNLLLTL